MSCKTDVYLITGFLGAGKTTFLNRIIANFPKKCKLTLLVNEFGEVGVDGTLIAGEDIDTIEISKGSIFCVCVKTDFIKGLYALSQTVQPDILIIESTGVANPTDLKKDLTLPIFNDRFVLKEQFCLIDGVHFLDAFEAFASVEKQIASSNIFIINKTDLTDDDQIVRIESVIRKFNSSPQVFRSTYADIPLDRFFSVRQNSVTGEPNNKKFPPITTEMDLDRYIDKMLDSPDLEITPPDLLVSATYQWHGSGLDQIKTMAEKLPNNLVRAKGFVLDDGVVYLFSYVMGQWSLLPSDIDIERIKHPDTLVFIGPPNAVEEVTNATVGGDWTDRGVFRPAAGR